MFMIQAINLVKLKNCLKQTLDWNFHRSNLLSTLLTRSWYQIGIPRFKVNCWKIEEVETSFYGLLNILSLNLTVYSSTESKAPCISGNRKLLIEEQTSGLDVRVLHFVKIFKLKLFIVQVFSIKSLRREADPSQSGTVSRLALIFSPFGIKKEL